MTNVPMEKRWDLHGIPPSKGKENKKNPQVSTEMFFTTSSGTLLNRATFSTKKKNFTDVNMIKAG